MINNNQYYKKKLNKQQNKNNNKKKIDKRIVKDLDAIVKEEKKQTKALRDDEGFERNISQYERTLLRPDLFLDAKCPGAWGKKSINLHRHITLSVKTDANGNLAMLYNPYILVDGALSVNESALFMASGSTNGTGAGLVDFTTPANMRFVTYPINYVCTSNTVNNYRLVSASAVMRCTNAVLNVSGFMSATVADMNFAQTTTPYTTGGAVNLPDGSSLNQAANAVQPQNISTSQYGIKCYPGMREYPVLTWLPSSNADYEWWPINQVALNLTAQSYSPESVFIFTCNGVKNVAAAADIQFEIFLNYELEPQTYSVLAGMEVTNNTTGSPDTIVQKLRKNNRYVSRVITDGRSSWKLMADRPVDLILKHQEQKAIKLEILEKQLIEKETFKLPELKGPVGKVLEHVKQKITEHVFGAPQNNHIKDFREPTTNLFGDSQLNHYKNNHNSDGTDIRNQGTATEHDEYDVAPQYEQAVLDAAAQYVGQLLAP